MHAGTNVPPTRRDFLHISLKAGILLGELVVIAGGAYVLGKKASHAILTLGTTDRRFAPEAVLPTAEQQSIPFAALRDGETLLGKRVTLPLSPTEGIDIETGFVSTPMGRDLHLRIPPKIFRITDEVRGRVIGHYVLDVLREGRSSIRIASAYGAAIITVDRCAAIVQTLRSARDRLVAVADIPFELRSPWRETMVHDVHFERIDE